MPAVAGATSGGCHGVVRATVHLRICAVRGPWRRLLPSCQHRVCCLQNVCLLGAFIMYINMPTVPAELLRQQHAKHKLL
jgi:hypothetical protein